MIDLETAPLSPIDVDCIDATIAEELLDARQLEIADGVFVGYKLLNRRMLGEKAAVVALGGFMGDLTSPDRSYEGLQLTALDRPVLMLDMPGHGLSTPHNRRQIIDLCLRRDVTSQAEPVVEAVQTIFRHDEAIDYFGVSHGSLLAMKAAELDPDNRVETVFGIDLPAVKRRLTLGLQLGYMVTDNISGRKRYLEAIEGTQLEADFEAFKVMYELHNTTEAQSFIRNNPGLFVLNLFSSINASPIGLWSWRQVMEQKDARVHVYTSEHGSVSDPDVISDFIDSLPPEQQVRSRQTIVAGEDHNIGMVYLMPRAVQWAKQAYNR